MLPIDSKRIVHAISFCTVCLLVSCKSAETRNPGAYSAYDERVAQILTQMTLEEKIGQMIQADQEFLEDPEDIETYFLGSILSGGNSDPEDGNTLKAWTDLYDRLQQHALNTRLGIPLLYGIDAVHGHNNVLGAVIFPHNIGLGCSRNPDLVEQIARITAKEIRATGINYTFAPCITVPRDERWGRTYEGFSENPDLVALLGTAAVRGLQGRDLSQPLSVLACAKHYLGDGGTGAQLHPTDQKNQQPRILLDQGDTRADETTLRRLHLPPYRAAIDAGVGSIMVSYSSWNGVKCTASKYLLTDVLKNELGFEGFLLSDYRAIDQLHDDYKTAIEIAINAGIDMGMVPSKYVQFFTLLKELVTEGKVPMSRIDDAVTRILRVKFAMDLMEDRFHFADRTLHKTFGSEQHRQVAREAVRQSLVLLKNEGNLLPFSKEMRRIHVSGKSADDIGNMCGGWTVTWQGESGKVTPGGTTILAAMRNAVSEETEVTFSADGANAAGADVGVVVISEHPYAEMHGDRLDLTLEQKDLKMTRRVKEAGVPVVAILISGRPMIINDVLEETDAFIAAWLPGTEGQGITDVLFGDYKPTGKLSFSWPRSMEQIPINVNDSDYDPLFEYGFGLTD